jgi:rhamnogalacturonyl hydrolase YesR
MSQAPTISTCTPVLERLLAAHLPAALTDSAYPARLFLQAVLEAPEPCAEAVDLAREQVIEHFQYPVPGLENGPFNHLAHAMFNATGSVEWWACFEESARGVLDLPRSPEGAWMHPRGRFGPGFAVLLDSFQEEAVQLLLLAQRLRARDPEGADGLEEQALEQFRLHRRILRNPDTGLWHNGRGWIPEDPAALSPGAWSRGHGWLLRGCVAAVDTLPSGDRRTELEAMFREIVATLLPLRNGDGYWPVLLNRAEEGSPSETSGTAMISTAILKAERIGVHLPSQAFEAGREALDRLLANCVDDRGEVMGVCPGPGPLVDEALYRGGGFSGDKSHGAFALLEACLERVAIVPMETGDA